MGHRNDLKMLMKLVFGRFAAAWRFGLPAEFKGSEANFDKMAIFSKRYRLYLSKFSSLTSVGMCRTENSCLL